MGRSISWRWVDAASTTQTPQAPAAPTQTGGVRLMLPAGVRAQPGLTSVGCACPPHWFLPKSPPLGRLRVTLATSKAHMHVRHTCARCAAHAYHASTVYTTLIDMQVSQCKLVPESGLSRGRLVLPDLRPDDVYRVSGRPQIKSSRKQGSKRESVHIYLPARHGLERSLPHQRE